jgi:tRNA1Val (adenine37-N6)-methyltransferase
MTRPFHFQQFTIHQEKTAMKVGFDAVLLGAWADVHGARRILDIGTGSGVLALMLAQRQPAAQVDGVEIDAAAAEEAAENVRRSPWPDRVRVLHCPIQKHEAPPYDLIVCNPPFFATAAGTPAPDEERRLARQDGALTVAELLVQGERLLGKDGRFALIWPYKDQDRLREEIEAADFYLQQQVTVRPNPQKPPHRLLLQFGRRVTALQAGTLTIEESRHQYTAEFTGLTADFYLTGGKYP